MGSLLAPDPVLDLLGLLPGRGGYDAQRVGVNSIGGNNGGVNDGTGVAHLGGLPSLGSDRNPELVEVPAYKRAAARPAPVQNRRDIVDATGE